MYVHRPRILNSPPASLTLFLFILLVSSICALSGAKSRKFHSPAKITRRNTTSCPARKLPELVTYDFAWGSIHILALAAAYKCAWKICCSWNFTAFRLSCWSILYEDIYVLELCIWIIKNNMNHFIIWDIYESIIIIWSQIGSLRYTPKKVCLN